MKTLLTYILINIAAAQEVPVPDSEAWRVGNRYYSVTIDKETKALISYDCLKKKKKCEAYKAVLNKRKISLSEKDRIGGKNPGAVACKKIYSGEILILRNQANDENAFCKFKDNSIVSASDLF